MLFVLGLVLGTTISYLYIGDVVRHYERAADTRIRDFKDAFDKGYQTQHHVKPFIEEKKEAEKEEELIENEEDYAGYLFEQLQEEENKPERWDD